MQMKLSFIAAALALGSIITAGCKDLGENPPLPPIPPRIEGVSADTIGAGEVLEIVGSGFGTITPTSAVVFAENVPATRYPEWTDTKIRVVVPDSAISGPVKVQKGTTESNVRSVVVLSAPPAGVSFSREIIPIFSANCTGCHGGTAGLFLTPGEAYTNLVNVPAQTGTCAGTPRVTPGNSSASALYLRVSGNCSQRMPLGGQLAAVDIELIRQWIDEGAENN